MKKSKKNYLTLDELDFDTIEMGFVTIGGQAPCGSCGGDNDRICSSICPTNGCRHDGCCGSNYDSGGEPSQS